ncbi:HipA family kinase [Endozoicomonas acroporae]|uniref:HipA family kinase n=1 Tax=Endozoicomonas acroporae TaxID=1701104 RepID=UPI000C78AB67|nr:HipA family kinase [Endozoicomonas acroporae]
MNREHLKSLEIDQWTTALCPQNNKGAEDLTQRIHIDEIVEESIQGYSGGVFRCIGDNGESYFLKGLGVGRPDLAKEWICANLAKAFGLPIADFALAEVCITLYEAFPGDWQRKIGHGTCFASREVKQTQWLEPATMAVSVPEQLQNDVLIFDRWIRNEDRTKGNPNLLWVPHLDELVVIDHNLAFDPDFTTESFFQHHIFASARKRICTDLATIAEYKERMEAALSDFHVWAETAKNEWPWRDLEETREFELDSDSLFAILNQYTTDQFWSMT